MSSLLCEFADQCGRFFVFVIGDDLDSCLEQANDKLREEGIPTLLIPDDLVMSKAVFKQEPEMLEFIKMD